MKEEDLPDDVIDGIDIDDEDEVAIIQAWEKVAPVFEKQMNEYPDDSKELETYRKEHGIKIIPE